MTNRALNFFAGPAALPLEVLKEVQAEMLDFKNTGVSVMEISHRSKQFQAVVDEAQADLLKILGLGDDYTVLFLGGGATHQFIMLAMNTLGEGRTGDYIVSGKWAERAYEEGGIQGNAHLVATSANDKRPNSHLPEVSQNNMTDDAVYLHFASNNTIFGTQWWTYPTPKPGVALVADMSSDFLSHDFDASKFDMLYAGAQKNVGPAGVAVVVMKKEWAAKVCVNKLPKTLDYKMQIKKGSMFNTPPAFNIYVTGKVFKWVLAQGGLKGMEERNRTKANSIYGAIDAHPDFYTGYVDNKEHRSWMNVTFNLPTPELEAKFIAEAGAKNMLGLKGYRDLGGIRASIYNSTSPETVAILAAFMEEFYKNNR